MFCLRHAHALSIQSIRPPPKPERGFCKLSHTHPDDNWNKQMQRNTNDIKVQIQLPVASMQRHGLMPFIAHLQHFHMPRFLPTNDPMQTNRTGGGSSNLMRIVCNRREI